MNCNSKVILETAIRKKYVFFLLLNDISGNSGREVRRAVFWEIHEECFVFKQRMSLFSRMIGSLLN